MQGLLDVTFDLAENYCNGLLDQPDKISYAQREAANNIIDVLNYSKDEHFQNSAIKIEWILIQLRQTRDKALLEANRKVIETEKDLYIKQYNQVNLVIRAMFQVVLTLPK